MNRVGGILDEKQRDDMNRTSIFLLSHKRSGTSALHRVFASHSQVSICHSDQTHKQWEPNFWNTAVTAIEGDPDPFVSRLAESIPTLKMPDRFTKETIFMVWDTLLEMFGPVVFDKSPQYLGNHAAVDLIREYRSQGRDVRLLSMIRNPWEVVTSQYEILGAGGRYHKSKEAWEELMEKFPNLHSDSPQKRDLHWVKKHNHLIQLIQSGEMVHLIRYEDLCQAPDIYFSLLFNFCGLQIEPGIISGYRNISAFRYRRSLTPEIRRWKPTSEFIAATSSLGYPMEESLLDIVFKEIRLRSRRILYPLIGYKGK